MAVAMAASVVVVALRVRGAMSSRARTRFIVVSVVLGVIDVVATAPSRPFVVVIVLAGAVVSPVMPAVVVTRVRRFQFLHGVPHSSALERI